MNKVDWQDVEEVLAAVICQPRSGPLASRTCVATALIFGQRSRLCWQLMKKQFHSSKSILKSTRKPL